MHSIFELIAMTGHHDSSHSNDHQVDMPIFCVFSVVPYFNPEQTSSDMTVKQGDTIDILCNATGRPPPTIQWTRLGGALLPIGKEMHFVSNN